MGVPFLHRQHQSRITVVVDSSNVGSRVQEYLHDLCLTVFHSHQQRRRPILILGVDINATADQAVNNIRVPIASRAMQFLDYTGQLVLCVH